jgi:hypothetical protein
VVFYWLQINNINKILLLLVIEARTFGPIAGQYTTSAHFLKKEKSYEFGDLGFCSIWDSLKFQVRADFSQLFPGTC